jgi:hypothetical protein
MNGQRLNLVNNPQKCTLNRFNYETVPERLGAENGHLRFGKPPPGRTGSQVPLSPNSENLLDDLMVRKLCHVRSLVFGRLGATSSAEELSVRFCGRGSREFSTAIFRNDLCLGTKEPGIGKCD